MSDVTFSKSLNAGLDVGAFFMVMITTITIIIFWYLYVTHYRPWKRLNAAVRYYGQTVGYEHINGVFFLRLADFACGVDIKQTIEYLTDYNPPFKMDIKKHISD